MEALEYKVTFLFLNKYKIISTMNPLKKKSPTFIAHLTFVLNFDFLLSWWRFQSFYTLV